MFIAEMKRWWWLVAKDLWREYRVPRVGPGMLLLGLVLTAVLTMAIDLPEFQRNHLVSALFWVAMFFAGSSAIERSLATERDHETWQTLLLYPVSPGTLFLAKTTLNFLTLGALTLVLAPAFVILAQARFGAHPLAFLAIALLANLGLAAIGTLVSAVTYGLSQRGNLLMLLLLPLGTPVILAAAEATRGLVLEQWETWGRWLQFLGCFAVLFLAVGTVLFAFVTEE